MKRAPPTRANTAMLKFGGIVRNRSTLNGDVLMLAGTVTFTVSDAPGGGETANRGDRMAGPSVESTLAGSSEQAVRAKSTRIVRANVDERRGRRAFMRSSEANARNEFV
jgi:hypothetical protein